MDFVVQKATELGVKRITPVLTEYGVVKLDQARGEKRREHWASVAASACEQSGRTRPPLIDAPMTLKDWFGSKPDEVDAELVLTPGAASSLTAIDTPTTEVCLLIGPEGGFSDYGTRGRGHRRVRRCVTGPASFAHGDRRGRGACPFCNRAGVI